MSGIGELTFEAGIAEAWHRIVSARRQVLLTTTVFLLLGLSTAFLLPSEYTATTTILPNLREDEVGALSRITAQLTGLKAPIGGASQNPEIYPPVITSRWVLSRLLRLEIAGEGGIPDGPLLATLDVKGNPAQREELAVRKLRRMIRASIDRRSGAVTIEVQSRNPSVATRIAGAIDTLVQQFLISTTTGHAGARRKFVEARVAEVQEKLASREADLLSFREKNLRIGNSPRLQLLEGRLGRALKEQEELYLALLRELETARIEEQKDIPTFAILDEPVRPVFRSWPRRRLIVGFSILIGVFVAMAQAVARRPLVAAPRSSGTSPLTPG